MRYARLAFLPAFVVVMLLSRLARAESCEVGGTSSASPAPMKLGRFVSQLADRIDACATEARRPDAARFFASHGIARTESGEREYVRMRTLFELTRDGGPLRLRWAVTNEEPTSKKVWAAWRASPPPSTSTMPSATAECDEISALFANLARKMGVRRVGLFWPTWNHTIAAWEPERGVRVLIPTTQVFLGCEDTFDATSFSSSSQKVVYEFPSNDMADSTEIPAQLSSFLLDQTTHYAGASLEVLAAIRAHRAVRLGSSVDPICTGRALARVQAAGPLGAKDERALLRYGATELGSIGTVQDVLAAMAR